MNLKIVIPSMLAAALVGTGLYGYLTYQYQTEIARTESLLRRGQYDDVITLLQPQISAGTEDARKRGLLAEAYYRTGQYEEVNRVLEPLMRYGKETVKALALSGWANLKLGEYILAGERFSRLHTRFPQEEALSEAGLGATALSRSERFRRKDLEEAQRRLTRFAGQTHSPEAVLYLTEYHLITHDYTAATEQALKAVSFAPFWSEPYVALGRCYLQDGKFTKAEDAFKKGLEFGAGEVQTNYYLARSMYQQGRLTDALDVFESLANSQTPTAVKAKEDAARIHILLNNLPAAAKWLEPLAQELVDPNAAVQLFQIYMRQGEEIKAKRLLANIIKKWPLSLDAQLELGNLQLQDKQWREANRTFMTITDDNPRHFWANYNLGCIAVQQGQLFQAPDYFELASTYADEFFPAKVNHALSLIAVERDLEGRSLLQKLYYEHENNPVIFLAQALERFLAGFPAVSLQRIEQSLQVLPNQAPPFLIRGEIFMRLYQFEKSKENFQKALELQPDNLRAQLGLAHVSFRLGDYHIADTYYNQLALQERSLIHNFRYEIQNGLALLEAANNNYTAALDIWDSMKFESQLGRQFSLINRSAAPGYSPTSIELADLKSGIGESGLLPELFFNIGVLSEKERDTPMAENMYQRLTKDYPTFLPAHFNLASFYERSRRYAQAETHYETAMKSAPNHIDILNNLAGVHVYQGNLNPAEDLLNQAAAHDPNNPVIETNRILVNLEQNDIPQAREKFEGLKTIVGQAPVTLAVQGLFDAQAGNWRDALKSFESALKNGDDNVYTFINHAAALTRFQRYDEAEASLQRAKNMEPRNPDVHRALGLLYAQTGLYDEARSALQTSVSIAPDQSDVKQVLQQIEKWLQS